MSDMPKLTESQAKSLIETSKVFVAPPSAAGASKTGIPQQKAVAGGLGGLIAFIVVLLAQKYLGLAIPPDLAAYVVGLLLVIVVPPAQRDVIEHLTDEVVHAAQRDPDTMVSSVLPPTQPVVGQPAIVIPPAKKD